MKKERDTASAISPQMKKLMDEIQELRFTDLDRDYTVCQQLLELSEKENHLYGMAYAYAYLGDCLIGRNETVKANVELLKAKDLCEKHRFLDLLPYVCTWLGIYYESQNDRQMAMHYYLDALDFAEKSGDILRQSILLNNIASQFQSIQDYTMGKEYYLKAYDLYLQSGNSNNDDPHFAHMLTNIISDCCYLKQFDEAKQFYAILEKTGVFRENKNQLYLCDLLISASTGDLATTRRNADKLMEGMDQEAKDYRQFFSTFVVLAETMIELEEEAYTRKILEVLKSICEDEYGNRLTVQYLWTQFCEKFGTEREKYEAYRDFYQLRKICDDILNHNLAEGILSKIKLRESIKKNEEMEKVKEILEDEAQLDELTRLNNRRSLRKFMDQLEESMVSTLAVIMIDVDYFKQFNDTYGHEKGDFALRAVADSMTEAGKEGIYNFRYGGDEFMAICKNKSREEAERYIIVLTEILKKKKIPHQESRCSDFLSLSIGYTFHNFKKDDRLVVTDLVDEADKALYFTKDRGRNGYCCFSEV